MLWALTFAALAANLALVAGPTVVSELLEPPSAEAATAAEPHEEPGAISVEAAEHDAAAPGGEEQAGKSDGETEETAGAAEAAKKESDKPDAESSASETTTSGDTAAAREAEKAALVAEADRVFQKIVRAYENMEPENAAAALLRLSRRDIRSTVRTLLAMSPRKCGAILDAISAKAPDTAAAITSEMIAQASLAALTPAR
jgi:flagellar motility protein MotE (MotC chaperone)